MPRREFKPTIGAAQAACERMGAVQVVVVAFDGQGHVGVVSYGHTKASCAAVKPLCNAIADALERGELPAPEVLR